VVTFVCDTGTRYLTKVYSDGWMVDQGLLQRPRLGDLRDLIGRRFDDGDVVSVAPTDTLLTAFNRMRSADLAQLPVIVEGRLVGLIDESDILLHVTRRRRTLQAPVRHHDGRAANPAPGASSMPQLREILDRGLTAVIADGFRFYGLITRFDLLNHCEDPEMSQYENKRHLATRVIHGGQSPDPGTGAVMPPIYATSTFAGEPGRAQGPRLRPLAQPDALGAGALRGRHRKRQRGLRLRLRPGRDFGGAGTAAGRLAHRRRRRHVRRHLPPVRRVRRAAPATLQLRRPDRPAGAGRRCVPRRRWCGSRRRPTRC
jgi:hypothetical protein